MPLNNASAQLGSDLIITGSESDFNFRTHNYFFIPYQNGVPVNFVTIEHSDNTTSVYVHLQENGVLVSVGDTVNQGDAIALSGSSGTGGAHLHFSVNDPDGKTLPVTFRNTKPHPSGLVPGDSYTAD